MKHDATIQVHLFGAFEIQQNSNNVALPVSRTSRMVLAYLCLHREQPIPRATLIGTFWANLAERRARRTLRQTLWHIRRALPNWIVSDAHTVQFRPSQPVWVDVESFRRLTRRGATLEQLRQGIELYRGDFLEGYYTNWILRERETLRERYLQTLEQIPRLCKSAGHYQQALEYTIALVQAEPWHEEAHREIMRLLFLLEGPRAALQHYQTYRGLCASARQEPHPHTVQLAEEITRRLRQDTQVYLPAAWQESHIHAEELPLIGRSEERKRLLAAIEPIFDFLGRGGGVILLEGEAGVGKTRLVQEVARDVRWRGGEVLWGAAEEGKISSPYEPLVRALESGLTPLRAEQISQWIEPLWLQVLQSLFPSFAKHFPDLPLPPRLEALPERIRLTEAFAQFLHAWSRFTPLVVILENLQWMGLDTLRLLAALTRRLKTTDCTLILTHRGGESRDFPQVWEHIQAIDRAGPNLRLTLSGLKAADTGELIRQALGMGQAAPLFEHRLYQETQGSPLFVLETLRALYDENLLRRDESGIWHTPWDESTTDYAELPLPPAVEQVIHRRLKRLLPEALRVIKAAAVLGDTFTFSLLRASSVLEPPALIAALRELTNRRFLNETPRRYRFNHNKTRQVVYAQIPPEERIILHRRAARALEAHPSARYAELAHHYIAGEVWDRAVEACMTAARRAVQNHVPEVALLFLEQALQILEAQHPFSGEEVFRYRCEIQETRLALYLHAGDAPRARQALEALSALARRSDEANCRARVRLQQAAYLFRLESKDTAACEAAQAALELARRHNMPELEARVWNLLGEIRHTQSRHRDAIDAFSAALKRYQSLGDTTHTTAIRLRLSMVYRDLGDLERAQEQAQVAFVQAQAQGDHINLGHAHNAFAWLARAQGDHQAEIEHCQAMYEHMRQAGYLYYEGVALNNLSLAYSVVAEYRKSIEASLRALQVFRDMGHPRGQTVQYLNLSSRYEETGEFDKMREVLETGLELACEYGFLDEEARMHLRAALQPTWERAFDTAAAHLQRAAEIAEELNYPQLSANVLLRQGELHLAQGDYAQGIHALRLAQARYREAGWTNLVAEAESAEAMCHFLSGNLEEAAERSRDAIQHLKAAAVMPHYYHFVIMQAAGQEGEAIAALRKAHAILERRLQAAPDESARRRISEEIPLHRELLAAWQKFGPRVITRRLPRIDAPAGRPLRDEERVDVRWTIAAPEDAAIPGKGDRRRVRLLRLMEEAEAQGAAPTLEDLAQALGVSSRTIRRDLAALRKSGQAVHTRGQRRKCPPGS